jgi:hypothetical protein
MLYCKSPVRLVAVAVLSLACVAPALADAPISIQVGGQFPQQTNARNAGGDAQYDLGLNYDFINAPVVPIQASFQFDDANGTNHSGSLNAAGFGLAGRLTTPLYAGMGLSVYNITAKLAYPGAPSVSGTGIGTNIFAGDRFLSLPGGVNFSLQATYRQLPALGGINASSIGVGLRVQL